MFSVNDTVYMARAIRLAERGGYCVRPNPAVGCVLVRDDQVVGEGWHQRAGGAHAEVHALQQAGIAAQGATAYVTLEPCSHYGKTPPCSDALVVAGVQRVVVAMQDPNPLVAGQGIQRLRSAGIQVDVGLLETSARALNPGFLSRMERGIPYVRAKVGASLDGRTALLNGQSQWITSKVARDDVQRWRARSAAIITGMGTVLHDNPRLTVRIPMFDNQYQPLRVLLDPHFQVDVAANLFHHPGQALVLISPTAWQQLTDKRQQLEAKGVHCHALPIDTSGCFDWVAILQQLAHAYAINDVLIEAGSRVLGSALRSDVVDELIWYQSGALMGDAQAAVHWSPALTTMTEVPRWTLVEQRLVGDNMRSRWLRPTPVVDHKG